MASVSATRSGGLSMSYDWEQSLLGPKEKWPPSLATSVNLVLSSNCPYILFWGSQHVCIYNASCIKSLGLKHPQSFVRPAGDFMGETWTYIKPLLEGVIAGHKTVFEDHHSPIARNGHLEEAYFTWAFSPVWADGVIKGVLSPVVETTVRVLSEQRFRILRALNTKRKGMSQDEVVSNISATLNSGSDFPFATIYEMSPTKDRLDLLVKTGIAASGPEFVPPFFLLDEKPLDGPVGWPVVEAISSGEPVVIRDPNIFGGARLGSPKMAILCPIMGMSGLKTDVVGVFIAGLNPRRPFDDDYKGFVDMVVNHISSMLSYIRMNAPSLSRVESFTDVDKAKTFFFSNVSHEFRTPLALITSQVEESLGDEESPLPPTQRARQAVVHKNTLRLLKLINSLLDLAKIDAGRMKKSFIPIDLARITSDLASSFRPAIENAGLYLTVIAPPLGEVIYLDTEMWETIICNLLSNALKFTFKGGITVTVRKNAEFAQILVSDTGVGIPEHEMPHLFERFHRVPGAVARSNEGAGLGLSLSLELVQILKGNIHVTSVVGEGSTFVVSVPLGNDHVPSKLNSPVFRPNIGVGPTFVQEAYRWTYAPLVDMNSDAQPIPPPSISPLPYPAPHHGYRLAHSPYTALVGDSRSSIVFATANSDLAKYVSSILSPLYRLEIVFDGKHLIELAAIDPPDIILSDSVLPGLSGHGVAKAVKGMSQLQRTPVILILSPESVEGTEQEKGDVRDTEKLYVDDYLVMPFSPTVILTRMKSHVELGRLRNNTFKFSLDKTEEYYRNLVHGLPIGVCEFNAAQEIIFHNQKWAEVTGFFEGRPADAVIGKDWIECVHSDDRAMVLEAVRVAHVSGNTASLEMRFKKRDMITWAFLDYKPSVTRAGVFQGACATFVDVTERQSSLRDAMVAEQKRASDADQQRRRHELFVDMICHEIRNPINGIHNNVDLLVAALRTREDFMRAISNTVNTQVLAEQMVCEREAIESIIMCANQQRVVADDVLHLSALESGKVVLNDVAFDPRKIVERVVKTYRAEAHTKQIQLLVELPKDRLHVRGDPDRLLQVLFNLVSNAIKFTEKSEVKRITVALAIITPTSPPSSGNSAGSPPQSGNTAASSPSASGNTTLVFSIEDSGLGMTPEEQVALFKRFSQASVHTYREYGGSGLGLFISKGLIELMGGDIKVNSTKFKGTKFYFTAQFKAVIHDENAMQLCSPSPDVPARWNLPRASLQILIAEDDVVNQRVLKRHLEQGGHAVAIAKNGQIALDFLKQQKFDLIFMDVEMPVMGGLDATRAIRREEERKGLPPIPIIGLSGNARQEYLNIALQAGMSSYIVKPYQKDDLFAKIHQLVPLKPTAA